MSLFGQLPSYREETYGFAETLNDCLKDCLKNEANIKAEVRCGSDWVIRVSMIRGQRKAKYKIVETRKTVKIGSLKYQVLELRRDSKDGGRIWQGVRADDFATVLAGLVM